MQECKVCGKKTDVVFNISFVATPVCETCAWQITYQYFSNLMKIEKEKEIEAMFKNKKAPT